MLKKFLLLLVSVGLIALSACGNDDGEASSDEVDQEGYEEEENATDDPLEFITDGELLLEDGANLYELKSYYTNDDTGDDGFNVYEDDGFTFKYAIVETENVAEGIEAEGQKEVQILGEVINETSDNAYFDDMEIKTDNDEKSELSFGLNGAGEADQRSKFIDGFPLEYDIPDSFTLTLIDPSIQGMLEDKFHEEVEVDYSEGNGKEQYEEFLDDNTVIESEFHKE